MFKQDGSSSRQKNDACFSRQVLRQYVRWFLSQHWKTLPRKGFILKLIERTYVPLKNSTRDF